ncbi:uncharacterized protein LOC110630328 [Manihot esculenta]|uniref:DUF7733 domain-containing protein n=1 Tax=Manihot esculenta TaxID=3983 RepID=A0A251JVV4_MANES|nr:uncharacterized protein LOC110630328 [Manihot esculenta]XP_043805414.1 uncharacterized protein LOC110630328 [Manihot esculenta]OAY32314.1 hypothetical protein MANES_13G008800v8 [Manihot esculenta]OAY32315.1 hypothetical protein MANES_13G008800v8 [Manihot esculenta]
MSGVSLATATRSEPNEVTTKATKPQSSPLDKQEQTMVGGIMGSLRVIELQLVAFIMVFSASGLVPLLDLIFPAFASAYILILARLAFPSTGGVSSGSQEIFQGSKFFRLYAIVGTIVGLFLPLAYVLGGFARGDDHAVRSATPHLFLLSFQILTENIISGLSLFSPPVRALVPLLYTGRRMLVILDWIQDVWLNKTLPANAQFKDVGWFWFGRILAAMNLLYFSVNLFGFLIPRFLPRAFEKYFQQRDETHWKMAEDKRSAAANKSQSTDKKAD